jgi:hypothetical protein
VRGGGGTRLSERFAQSEDRRTHVGLAAGELLAMLTDSLMPFALDRGGRFVGFWTVVGFAVAILPRSA